MYLIALFLSLIPFTTAIPYTNYTHSNYTHSNYTHSNYTHSNYTHSNYTHPSWSNLTTIPIAPRQEHSTVYLSTTHSIYILGGIIPAGPYNTTTLVQRYSLYTHSWHSAAPLPIPLNHPNVAALGGRIYVLGGLTPTPPDGAWRAIRSAAFVYCPESDAWTTMNDIPEGLESGSAAVGTYAGKVYLAGGLRTLSVITGEQDTLNGVAVYNTKRDVWEDIPAAASKLPEGRDHAGTAVVDGVMYVLGGRIRGQENVRDTVFALSLDVLEDGWTLREGNMPTARGGVSSAAVGKKVYVFGGEGDPTTESGVFPQVEVYDTVTETWGKLSDMSGPVHGTYAAAVGNKVYIPGGGVRISAEPSEAFQVFEPSFS